MKLKYVVPIFAWPLLGSHVGADPVRIDAYDYLVPSFEEDAIVGHRLPGGISYYVYQKGSTADGVVKADGAIKQTLVVSSDSGEFVEMWSKFITADEEQIITAGKDAFGNPRASVEPRHWEVGARTDAKPDSPVLVAVGLTYQSDETGETLTDCIRTESNVPDRENMMGGLFHNIYCRGVGLVEFGGVLSDGTRERTEVYIGVHYGLAQLKDIKLGKAEVKAPAAEAPVASQASLKEPDQNDLPTGKTVDFFQYSRPVTDSQALVILQSDLAQIIHVYEIVDEASYRSATFAAVGGGDAQMRSSEVVKADDDVITISKDGKTRTQPRFVHVNDVVIPATNARLVTTDVTFTVDRTGEVFKECLRTEHHVDATTFYNIYCRETGLIENGKIEDGKDVPSVKYLGISYKAPTSDDITVGKARPLPDSSD